MTLLNEIGLDPGIDHLSAMQLIHDAHRRGGKVVSFRSLCGGLPAPEAADNPLQYKFSWSPRGVLSAGLNSSRYLENGKVGRRSSPPPKVGSLPDAPELAGTNQDQPSPPAHGCCTSPEPDRGNRAGPPL